MPTSPSILTNQHASVDAQGRSILIATVQRDHILGGTNRSIILLKGTMGSTTPQLTATAVMRHETEQLTKCLAPTWRKPPNQCTQQRPFQRGMQLLCVQEYTAL